LVNIPDGGCFPLTAAIVLFAMMARWRHGRELMAEKLSEHTELLDRFVSGAQCDAQAAFYNIPSERVVELGLQVEL
jgi:K+ transporter